MSLDQITVNHVRGGTLESGPFMCCPASANPSHKLQTKLDIWITSLLWRHSDVKFNWNAFFATEVVPFVEFRLYRCDSILNPKPLRVHVAYADSSHAKLPRGSLLNPKPFTLHVAYADRTH